MKYSIENKGTGIVMIRVFVPERLAASFLAFIDQKSRENLPVVRSVSSQKNENYFIELNARAGAFFDSAIAAGIPIKSALSETNYKLKSVGYANVSYDITKQILQKQGKLKRKIQ